MWLRQSTTVNIKLGPAVSQTDAVTEKTALAPTVNLTKGGAAIAARNSVTAIAHDANGWYTVELNATDTGTLGRLQVYFRDPTNQLPVWDSYMVVPAVVYDAMIANTDNLDISLVQWLGIAPNALQTGRVDSYVGAVASGAIAAASFAANALDAVWSTATRTLSAAGVQAIWDALTSALTTAGSIGKRIADFLTGDAFVRLGAPAGASTAVDIAAVKTDTGNLVTRITAALFSGITSMAQWLGLLAGKQVGDTTARTEIRATGAGAGTYDETTDAQEALRDRGDAAWVTVTAASIRSAVGMGSANLDTQIAALPTAAANRVEMDANSTKLANLDATTSSRATPAQVLTQVNAALDTAIPGSPTANSVNERIQTIDNAYTATRGGYLDNLSVGAVAQAATQATAANLATANTALTDLQARTPAALVGGRMDANVGAMATDTTAPAIMAAMANSAAKGTVDNTAFTATTTIFESSDLTFIPVDTGSLIGRTVIFYDGGAMLQAGTISAYSKTAGLRARITISAITRVPTAGEKFVVV